MFENITCNEEKPSAATRGVRRKEDLNESSAAMDIDFDVQLIILSEPTVTMFVTINA